MLSAHSSPEHTAIPFEPNGLIAWDTRSAGGFDMLIPMPNMEDAKNRLVRREHPIDAAFWTQATLLHALDKIKVRQRPYVPIYVSVAGH